MLPPKNVRSAILKVDPSRRFASSPSFRTLKELGFFLTGRLVRNGDHNTRVTESINRSFNGAWTSKEMYQQLNWLQEADLEPHARAKLSMVSVMGRAVSVALDDRERGLVPVGNRKLNIDQEYSKLYVGRSWKSVKEVGIEEAEDFSSQQELARATGPQIGETEKGQPSEYVPRAIVGMYERAIQEGENIIRGAISNGIEWEFIILRINENGRGGGYKVSPPVVIESEPEPPYHVVGPGPDIAAAILAHWIPRRHDDLDGNDWFVANKT